MTQKPTIDEAYVAARDKLIPRAENYADKVAGQRPIAPSRREADAWAARWNGAFHRKMNKLAAPMLVKKTPSAFETIYGMEL